MEAKVQVAGLTNLNFFDSRQKTVTSQIKDDEIKSEEFY